MSSPAIELTGVSVSFPNFDTQSRSFKRRLRPDAGRSPDAANAAGPVVDTVALTDVSLTIGAGERVAIIGANASGKTTLVRVMAGLLTPVAGLATVHAETAVALDSGVGFGAEATILDTMGLQGVLLGLTRRGASEFADRVLDFGELTELADHPLRMLTPGAKGRLAIAMVVHSGAGLLLFDEVFDNVDPAFARRTIDHLKQSMTEESTLVIVGRQRAILDALCATAIVLEAGVMVVHGPFHDVMARYGKLYTY